MRDLLNAAASRASRYLETLDARGVAPSPQAVEALARLGGPLPDGPSAPQDVLALLDE
jgi:hypothetical protein